VSKLTNPIMRDSRDVELLTLLVKRPRSTVSELARHVGMSAPAVRERIQRLEKDGVIKRWSVEIDTKALGYQVTAFVRIRPMAGKLTQIARLAERLPEVAECYRITGEDCFIMRVHLKSLESMDELLDQFLAFGQTTTSIVQSSIVEPRNVLLS